MKYYVLNNKKDVIYGGVLSRTSTLDGEKDYIHNIKVYYKKNSKGIFEEYQNNDLNIDLILTKNLVKGLVKEYPTLEAAKKAIGR